MLPIMTIVTLLCLGLLPVSVGAEEITLREAVRAAVRNRPQAVAARAEAEAAEASADAAGGRLLPRIGLEENFLITDEPASSLFISLNQEDLTLHTTADPYNHPPTRHDFETRLSLEQPLFDARLWHARRGARQGALAGAARARWSAEEAAFAAFRSYLQLQQSDSLLRWARSARDESAEIERLARERYDAGIGLKADHLRARVALSEAERQILAARNDIALARRSLAIAMGRPGTDPVRAAPVTEDLLADAEGVGAAERADLEALAYGVAQRDAAVAESRAAYLPRLQLSASYSLHDEAPFGNDAGSWRVWSGLSWDIWHGNQRRHRLIAAQAEKRAARAMLQESANQAAYRVTEARLRTEEARRNLETARLAVSDAEESLYLLQQRYANGLTSLSDLLGVRAALDRARLDELQAETALLATRCRRLFEQGIFLQTLLPQEDSR